MAAPIINYLFRDYYRLFGIDECKQVLEDAGRIPSTAARYANLMRVRWVDQNPSGGKPGGLFTGNFQTEMANKFPDYAFQETVERGFQPRQPFLEVDSATAYIDSTGVIDYCVIVFESASYRVYIYVSGATGQVNPTLPAADFAGDIVPGDPDGVEP